MSTRAAILRPLAFLFRVALVALAIYASIWLAVQRLAGYSQDFYDGYADLWMPQVRYPTAYYLLVAFLVLTDCAIMALIIRLCWRWNRWEMAAGLIAILSIAWGWCFYLWSIPASTEFFATVMVFSLYLFPLFFGWGLGWWIGGVLRAWFRRRRKWPSEKGEMAKGHGNIIAVLWIMLTLASLWAWPRFWADQNERIIPPWHTVDLIYLQAVRVSLAGNPPLTVYEGLPPLVEGVRKLTPGEAAARVRRSNLELFYAQPIDISAEDARKLREILEWHLAFTEWSGPKLCGNGFHPDWAVTWPGTDGQIWEAQFCFGCHEAKIIGPWGLLYLDDLSRTFDQLGGILNP